MRLKGINMENKLLKRIAAALLCALLLALAACGGSENGSGGTSSGNNAGSEDAATDSTITAREAEGEFTITTADGRVDRNGDVYTVTGAGTYTLRGRLSGQVIVSAGQDDEVALDLSGTTISCSTDSPLKIVS